MKSIPIKLVACAGLTLMSACAMPGHSVTRAQDTPLVFYTQNDPAAELVAQAEALEGMADDLVRQSMRRGAMTGAAVGCGIALISASQIEKCAAGAVAAGAAGAVIGRAHGMRKVTAQVEDVSLQEVSGTLRGMQGQVSRVTDGLADYLAAQDARVAQLQRQRDEGGLSEGEFKAAVAPIRANRAALASALEASSGQINLAKTHLHDVSARAHNDAQWQIKIADEVEDDIASARERITLF